MADVNVSGLAELNKLLEELPGKLRANVMRGGLRAGFSVVKVEAAANIHSVSGLLAKGLSIGTRVRGDTVSATITAKGKHGFVARWVEFGTAVHLIRAKLGHGLKLPAGVVSEVLHPGGRPKPFMRPALDSQAQAATIRLGEYIKDRLSTQHGIDTAYINVQGDE